jgi:hypothetical protein
MRGGFQAAAGLLVLARREGEPERNRERARRQTCDAEREVAGFMAMGVSRWRSWESREFSAAGVFAGVGSSCVTRYYTTMHLDDGRLHPWDTRNSRRLYQDFFRGVTVAPASFRRVPVRVRFLGQGRRIGGLARQPKAETRASLGQTLVGR